MISRLHLSWMRNPAPVRFVKHAILPFLVLVATGANTGYGDSVSSGITNQEQRNTLAFDLHWPPQDPAAENLGNGVPLLRGRLCTRYREDEQRSWVLNVRIELERLATEEGRESWNTKLSFPDIDWMRYVRVWDAEHQWLWPNLSYLLRIHGQERFERYGGIDPGKGVDNDFAAVLIRKYDFSGQAEAEVTKSSPLVAAEWYPDGQTKTDKTSVVNKVRSDEFTLHLGKPGAPTDGQARVWLIFADFLGAKPPASWPKKPEYAGGILAFFEVNWSFPQTNLCQIQMTQCIPRDSTGFNWERWAKRTRIITNSFSTAKLFDAKDGD